MVVACSSKKENWDSELSMGWWNWELTCRSLEACGGFGQGLVKPHLCSKSHEGRQTPSQGLEKGVRMPARPEYVPGLLLLLLRRRARSYQEVCHTPSLGTGARLC